MPQLLHCDVARKAGSLVWLCYNLDSGNPARRNPRKRRFLASEINTLCVYCCQHFISGVQVNECLLWRSPGCEHVCVYLSQFGSQHRAVAAHSKAVPQELTWSTLAAEGRGILSRGERCSHAHGSSCPTAALESILVSTFFLHLILPAAPLPQISKLSLSKVTADKG